nr:aminoglycoside phosphotransferase family protein [Clostridia bacterium]
MSVTKNHQSNENLLALCAAAFPQRKVTGITELTEGMFNAAYRIDFADGASVLKIAAADATGLLSNECNLMQAEVAAMGIAQAHGLSLVPQVQHADFTHTLCSGSYFFMECLPGRSLHSCFEELPPAQSHHVMTQVGAFQRQTANIHSESFGLLGDTRRFPTLHGLIRLLFTNVLGDAAAKSINLGVNVDEVLARLDADAPVFAEIKTPSLVHWDMWEGNIFVENGELCGVIDWERAMWGEPLMDDRFRRHNRPAAFLEGYGQTVFSPAESRRLAWYDLFLYLTMITESTYRQYEDVEGSVAWLRPLVAQSWRDICQG